MTILCDHYDADVLIVGAGPVGLTLALDLASRGASVVVVETRGYLTLPSVKCNHVSARSMEYFRRLGLAQKLRAAGLPAEYPNDVVFRTTVTGTEIARIPIPCRANRYSEKSSLDAWWPTPEPPHRINQIFLEPIMLEHASKQPGITLLHRTQFTHFVQDASGVVAWVRDIETRSLKQLRARYLVGCDGGRSQVRRQIGAKLEGDAVIQRVQSTYIRAPRLVDLSAGKPAWYCYVMNPRRCGAVIAIDGRETWVIHNHLNAEEPDFESVDRDESIRHILGVDASFHYETIAKEDWIGRRLLADHFRDSRVFIAGDAAHLWVPYAGYGMNAGIADAVNLAWVLCAHMQGWADARILDAYAAERQPVTNQVSHFAMDHAQKVMSARKAVPADIEKDGPIGETVRAEIGRHAYQLNVQQFCCAGLNFGYYYTDSPILVFDDETAPSYSMGDFTESTVPGCRLPHFWLRDGRSIYDALGLGYTLLRVRRAPDPAGLATAAQRVGMPLEIINVSQENLPGIYQHTLVLCRTDQHVAWRSDTLPSDLSALIDHLRGALPLQRQNIPWGMHRIASAAQIGPRVGRLEAGKSI
ncbi:MAG: FAD-dependent oxidoreductase [Burkholderiaceae bacterium]|nr:MAG: FAD-dependent oxidoreductase [Burkholderiaceae bacterium]TAM02117.1 MAG: FAD-dependent oxidoreductase [Pusillimonas sp.]